MGRGKAKQRARGNGAMVGISQAHEWLKQDLPEAVKVKIRLATRGGRQQRRRCLGCGAQGVYVEVYTPYAVIRPMSDGGQGIKIYWTCSKCHGKDLTPALEARLREGR
jgi:hypothetical protein